MTGMHALQATGGASEATGGQAGGAAAKKGRFTAKKLKPYTPAKMVKRLVISVPVDLDRIAWAAPMKQGLYLPSAPFCIPRCLAAP